MSTMLRLIAPGSSPAQILMPAFLDARRGGRRVWYLVPNARTRRRRLRELALREPLIDPPVGTLRDLVERRLRTAGHSPPEPPDPHLSALLLRDALARAWPGVAAGPGLERAAHAAISTLLDDGWTCETFGAALERLEMRHGPGGRIAVLWRVYGELCAEADSAAPLRGARDAELLRQDPPQLLLVEGGAAPGALGARLLGQLVDAVTMRGGDILATALDVPTVRAPYGRGGRLLSTLLGVEPVAAAEDGSRPAALSRLARELFRGTDPGVPEPTADRVVRLTAPDAWDTADLVAREIQALLRKASSPEALLQRGVAIVCPSAADREIAEAALRRHGLPVAAVPREPIAVHPGGRFLMLLLDLLEKGRGTPLESVLELLAADGWGIAAAEADSLTRTLQLEGAVTAGQAAGMLEGESGRAAAVTQERLGRLFALHDRYTDTRTSAERSMLLRGVLRRRWAREPEQWVLDPRRGAWHRHGHRSLLAGHCVTPAVRGATGYARPLRRLDDLLAALDERARRTGAEPSPVEWLGSLRTLLGNTRVQIGSEPALGVRIESAGWIEPADVVFVLGLVERRFPRGPRQDAFLPDVLRNALARDDDVLPAQLSTDFPDGERERFLLSCGAARQRLYLCHPRTDSDGREVLASFFVEEAARCLGLVGADSLPQRRRSLRSVVPEPDACVSATELRAALAAALRDPELDGAEREEVCRALDALLAADDAFRGVLLGRFSDWPATLRHPRHRRYLSERAERLSASQLGTYDHCGFRHFAENRLEPVPIRLPLFDPLRRGGIIHHLLFRFGTEWDGWSDPGAAITRLQALEPPEAEPSVFATHRNLAEWKVWKERLCEFLHVECDRVAAAGFRPEYHELGFGRSDGPRDPRSRPDPVELTVGGGSIRFSGVIDRIDVREGSDGVRYGIALDYKTGKVDRYRKEIESGDELQLLLYLRVLEEFGIRPAAALYLSVADGGIAGVVHERFADDVGSVGERVIMAGDAAWSALRTQAERRIAALQGDMSRAVIEARPKDWECRPCELQGLCRIHLWKAKEHA